MTRVTLPIAADHPAFAGHFPTRPIVPGVVLLDESLRALDAAMDAAMDAASTHDARRPWRIASAKFLSFVEPGEIVHLEYDRASPDGPFRLRVFAGHSYERLAVTCSASPIAPGAPT